MTLAAAAAADARQRDRIAVAMDELLAEAPLLRAIGARLLVRPVSRGAQSTMRAIARELRVHHQTLSSRIFRAGGASVRAFRREIILARVAAIVEMPGVPWPIAAEILGTPRAQQLLALIWRSAGIPGGLWRERASATAQLEEFRGFLIVNALPWSTVVLPGPGRDRVGAALVPHAVREELPR